MNSTSTREFASMIVTRPSIDAAKKIADALEVSLDNLVGEGAFKAFDKKTLQRFKDLEHLEEDKKKNTL